MGSFPLTELPAVSPAGPVWPGLSLTHSIGFLSLVGQWPPHSSHPICLADYFQLGLQRLHAAITPQPQWLLLKITFGWEKTSVWWAAFYTKQLKSGCGQGGGGPKEWQNGTIKRRIWKKGEGKGSEEREGVVVVGAVEETKYIYRAWVSHLLEVLGQVSIHASN